MGKLFAFTCVSFIPAKGGIDRKSNFRPSLIVDNTHWSSVISFHWPRKYISLPATGISGKRHFIESCSIWFASLASKRTYHMRLALVTPKIWWLGSLVWSFIIGAVTVWFVWPVIRVFCTSWSLSTRCFLWIWRFPFHKGFLVSLWHKFIYLLIILLTNFQFLCKFWSKNTLTW